MSHRLLKSHEHFCFHSHICNVHHHPDLHRCVKGAEHESLLRSGQAPDADVVPCTGAISADMAKQAGYVDDDGNPVCPLCEGPTVLEPGEVKAEIHAKLCTDPTIHYPEMRKAGKITEDEYKAWKATLTHDERCGIYKRVPDVHVMASFTHDETALMKSDPEAFVKMANDRIRDRAESALLHQAPHRHRTTTPKIAI